MTVRTGASLVALAIIFVWVGLFLRFIPLGESAVWGIGYLAAFLLGANLSIILAMRLFRCPHCAARFGWHTFTRYGWSQPWAFSDCWNCGKDLNKK